MKPLPCLNNEFTGALLKGTDVVWLPLPKYDSPSLFSSILDEEKGGHFLIEGEVESQKYVVPNVVKTVLKDKTEVTDLLLYGDHGMVRKVHGGKARVVLSPSFNYGRAPGKVEKVSDKVYKIFGEGHDFLEVHFLFDKVSHDGNTWEVEGDGYVYLGYFSDERFGVFGKNVSFNVERGFERTVEYWKNAMRRERNRGKVADIEVSGYTGDQLLEAYENSVGILLGLMYNPTGAVVGAPTTSLPEVVGGPRNWDARFAWVRDSSTVAEALTLSGYAQEARRIIEFLSRMVSFVSKPFMYSLYAVDGSLPGREEEVSWLSGYMGSRPVRIGNDSPSLVQLDLEGTFLHAFYKYYEATGDENYVKSHVDVIEYIADWVSDNWKGEDAGMWEERGERAQNVHSKVMAWVALERAGKLMKAIDRDNPWKEARKEVKDWVMENGVVNGKFVKVVGREEVDSSLLTLPLYGFLDVNNETFQATLKEIERKLNYRGLLKRYERDFLGECVLPSTLSSLWLARVYTRMGKLEEAKAIVKAVLDAGKGFYLVGERIDVDRMEFTGNYPHAFSQANLIMAIEEIAEAESKRKETEREKEEGEGEEGEGEEGK
ncbi:hypothetical protein IC006_0564 [Sulfuracidifex tepidarius]|uniref:Uncharacterized protein n=1 Tax=Sulfuracidifex tepidarius TaxID=1294262 RepID=A0A510DT19_9CREN|nr:hypothetical protein IC006_0564 [Sulfuracidifex tepidarius]